MFVRHSKNKFMTIYGVHTMIGNSSSNQLHQLMQFIMESCVCSSNKITVQLNGLSGLARRPIAHTCNYVIELPTADSHCDDFCSDFHCFIITTC